MEEIAQLTFIEGPSSYDVLHTLTRILYEPKPKEWIRVLKALRVLDFCLRKGSQFVVIWAKEMKPLVQALKTFGYSGTKSEGGRWFEGMFLFH